MTKPNLKTFEPRHDKTKPENIWTATWQNQTWKHLSRDMTKPNLKTFEPRHDKTKPENIWATTWQNQQNECAPRSSLCTQWVAKDLSFLHADSKDSDQTQPRSPKFLDRYAWANSADPDQTAPSLIRVYTVCHSACIIWTHYSMVEPQLKF